MIGSPTTLIRSTPRPGDLGAVVEMHGRLYAEEYGLDTRIEASVAEALARFEPQLTDADSGSRLWVAERDGSVVGAIGITAEVEPDHGRLRWFLVEPGARGHGIGRALLAAAIEFCRDRGYTHVHLLTFGELTSAARLYAAAGFERVTATRGTEWSQDIVEERWELRL